MNSAVKGMNRPSRSGKGLIGMHCATAENRPHTPSPPAPPSIPKRQVERQNFKAAAQSVQGFRGLSQESKTLSFRLASSSVLCDTINVPIVNS